MGQSRAASLAFLDRQIPWIRFLSVPEKPKGDFGLLTTGFAICDTLRKSFSSFPCYSMKGGGDVRDEYLW
jgi:hypothetical protein